MADLNRAQVGMSGKEEYLQRRFAESSLQRSSFQRWAPRIVVESADGVLGLAKRAADRLRSVLDSHIEGLSDESQRTAAQLTFAELNKTPPAAQAKLVEQGAKAAVVAEAAAHQRRVPVEVQTALVEHCIGHTTAMRYLASRADADYSALAVLADSKDERTRINVAANVGPRMRIIEPARADEKQAIFDSLVARFESDYAPHLVPVCTDAVQLKNMYSALSKTLGTADVFVDNPHTPESVLLDIAASPTMHIVQHDASRRARELLQARAQRQEPIFENNDLAPS